MPVWLHYSFLTFLFLSIYNSFHGADGSNHPPILVRAWREWLVQHCVVVQEPKLCCDQAHGTGHCNTELPGCRIFPCLCGQNLEVCRSTTWASNFHELLISSSVYSAEYRMWMFWGCFFLSKRSSKWKFQILILSKRLLKVKLMQ